MRPASSLTAVAAALALAAAPALGAGFGRGTNLSQLGQPLLFTAVLQLAADEPLSRECVHAEVQSGDNLLPADQVRVALESPTGSDERRIRVTTRSAIDEPIVTVTLSVGCEFSLSRRYVAFVDPPLPRLAQSTSADLSAPAAAASTSSAPNLPKGASTAIVPGGNPPVGDAARLAVERQRERAAEAVSRRLAAAAAAAAAASASTPPAPAPVRPRASALAVPPVALSAASSRPPSPRGARATPFAAAARPTGGPRLQLEARTAPPPAPPPTAGSPASTPNSPTTLAAAPASAAPALVAPTAPAAGLPGVALAAPSAPVAAVLPAPVPLAGASAAVASVGASAAVPTAVSGRPADALPAAAASTAPASDDPAVLAQRRVQALEESLASLRNDARADRDALATLQARLQRSEAERYGSPLVYALSLLSALLALGLAVLWRRQARARRTGQWWVGREPGPVPSMYRERETTAATPLASAARAAPSEPATLPGPVEPPRAESSFTGLDSTRPAPFVSGLSSTRYTPAQPETAREMSVEELIDLEQQVEFFVVLGQTDAAIDLLMNHVRSDGGISPLPYLKLLEIHHRSGEAAAYRQIRERFNQRFNAHAPEWGHDLTQGRAIADYPEALARLQALWSTPVRAMETIDASLFRRDTADETFELPAYRELLLLYAVARDLAERAATVPAGNVDFALPLDDPRDEPIALLTASSRRRDDFRPSEMSTLPVDLDVSFDAPVAPPTPIDAETVPSALRRSGARPFAGESNFLNFDGEPSEHRGPG